MDAFKLYDSTIDSLTGGDSEVAGSNRAELFSLRINYAKKLTKTGLLVRAREQLDDKVLS